MKKYFSLVLIVSLFFAFQCKKEAAKQADQPTTLAKKYAKYRVAVYKDKELKSWLSTMEKAESMDLINEEKYVNAKKKQIDLAKVKLSDGKEGYIDAKHLADKPIVITGDNVKAFVRPDIGSKQYCTLPKGTIAFIIEEKADWVRIYAGAVGEKKVMGQWVKGGYSTDEKIIIDAKEYDSALNLLKEQKPEKIEKAIKEAREKLTNLSNNPTSPFSEIAKAKLMELDGQAPAKDAPAPPEGGMGDPAQ